MDLFTSDILSRVRACSKWWKSSSRVTLAYAPAYFVTHSSPCHAAVQICPVLILSSCFAPIVSTFTRHPVAVSTALMVPFSGRHSPISYSSPIGIWHHRSWLRLSHQHKTHTMKQVHPWMNHTLPTPLLQPMISKRSLLIALGGRYHKLAYTYRASMDSA